MVVKKAEEAAADEQNREKLDKAMKFGAAQLSKASIYA